MLGNNYKIALRTLLKNKTNSVINILGLAIGIASVLLIYRMVSYELSFNKNFENYDRIVRVVSATQALVPDNEDTRGLPIPAMAAIEEQVGQFEKTSRVQELFGTINLRDPNSNQSLDKIGLDDQDIGYFVQATFFEIFDFDFLAGNPKLTMTEPNTLVLSKPVAEKAFGKWEDAMGQLVYLDNSIPCKVVGIYERLPANTDFLIPYMVSYETLRSNAGRYRFREDSWGSTSSMDQFYALLQNKEDLDAANAALANIGREQYDRSNQPNKRQHIAQPLADLHYNDQFGSSGSHITPKSRLWVLGFIGLLILIMACFNFINLTTAQSILRAKEVGVRKTLGSARGQLIQQFLGETALIVLFAVGLGIFWALLALPFLKQISYVPDQLPFILSPVLWIFIIGISVLIIVMAGWYPAVSLASYRPIQALNDGSNEGGKGKVFLRKSLIVLQFIIAQSLIISAIVTILQLDYIRNKDLGFDEKLVYTFVFNSDSATIARQNVLKNKLLQIPEVERVSLSSSQPISNSSSQSNFSYDTRPDDEEFDISIKFCDSDYLDTYSLELVAGRWISPRDTMQETIINETLVQKLDILDPKEVVGKTLTLGQTTPLTIVGVMKDFHAYSLHEEHPPLMFSSYNREYSDAGIKIRVGSNLATAIRSIKQVYDEVLPEQVMYSSFLDEDIAQMYEDDTRLSNTSKAFGLIAILISCLGLFGLATHATTQRVKEIGIRKVLGASVSSILGLLTKDFLKLVLLALLIASPIAWYFMTSWLSNFAYRVNLHWWVFAITGVAALAIAFLTVGFQSVKAAIANPVDSLRDE